MKTSGKILLGLAAAALLAGAAPRFGRRPLWTRLLPRRFDRGLLQDGYRAVTLPVDGLQLAHLRTGDRVDVLATFDARLGKAGPQKLSATVLQNVEVVGVDMPGGGRPDGGLVLLLDPNEAQYAALMARQSELSIALRDDGDVEVHPMEMASAVKLFR